MTPTPLTAREKILHDALIAISEYWNHATTDEAMADACQANEHAAFEALAAFAATTPDVVIPKEVVETAIEMLNEVRTGEDFKVQCWNAATALEKCLKENAK